MGQRETSVFQASPCAACGATFQTTQDVQFLVIDWIDRTEVREWVEGKDPLPPLRYTSTAPPRRLCSPACCQAFLEEEERRDRIAAMELDEFLSSPEEDSGTHCSTCGSVAGSGDEGHDLLRLTLKEEGEEVERTFCGPGCMLAYIEQSPEVEFVWYDLSACGCRPRCEHLRRRCVSCGSKARCDRYIAVGVSPCSRLNGGEEIASCCTPECLVEALRAEVECQAERKLGLWYGSEEF